MTESTAPKYRSKWRKGWRWVSLVLQVCVAYYFVFAGGLRDLVQGRFHRNAQEMFIGGLRSDEVQIFLLQGEDGKRTEDKFAVSSFSESWPVFGTISITAKDQLKEFLDLWCFQEVNYGAGGMCHDPAYGFRLYESGKLLRETTICWDCSNFYVRFWPFVGGHYGFNSRSAQGKMLLEFCDQRLPYKRYPKKEPATAE